MKKDIFGNEITVGAKVAVSRQVGYSVSQYAATVLDVYKKDGQWKVRVEYRQEGRGWGIPDKPQHVAADKVVVVEARPDA